jgi:hypothetical protein
MIVDLLSMKVQVDRYFVYCTYKCLSLEMFAIYRQVQYIDFVPLSKLPCWYPCKIKARMTTPRVVHSFHQSVKVNAACKQKYFACPIVLIRLVAKMEEVHLANSSLRCLVAPKCCIIPLVTGTDWSMILYSY